MTFLRSAIMVAFLVQFSPQARSDSFQAYVESSGDCENTGSQPAPVSITNLPCSTTGDSFITGSAKSGPLYLGAAISGSGNSSRGDVGVNFDLILHEDQLADMITGGVITFYWSMDGLVSVGTGDEIGLNVIGGVDGVRVIEMGLLLPGPELSFFSRILGSTPVARSASGDYDIYMGFDNSVVGPATSDFLNTIQLYEITVTDPATGQAINGITFSDNYGDMIPTNQQLLTSNVPECNTFLLLLSILGPWVAVERIRRKT